MIKVVHARVYKGGRRRWFTLAAAVRSEALMLLRDAEKADDIIRVDGRDFAEVMRRIQAEVGIGTSPPQA